MKVNDVVFTPADIKGLLAEVYMYQDIEFLGGVRYLGDDQFAVADQRFPEIRWNHSPVRALEKLHLEVDLEVLDELGGRRLRYLKLACRVLDAAEVTDSNQQAQLFEFQARDRAIDDAIVAGGHLSSSEADALCQLLHLADHAHRSQCRALRIVGQCMSADLE